jgi:methionyl-tRNA synthetase
MTQKHLITSALPYINGIKHLGNLIGSLLPADVYARFLRQRGEEVLYICGTDEHGTPAEIAAHEHGQAIEDYCAHMYDIQRDIYDRFGIQFDHFGRSSAPSNHHFTQEIFLEMWHREFIEEREIHQYYSLEDDRFLPDRYVEGTCPHCGYAKARGDQCDGCGTLLDPTDLEDPYSSLSGSRNIELRATKHLFLLLDKLSADLETWTQEQSQWPDMVKGIAKKWLKEGLQPRCITRDLKWGVPVPLPGYETKVFYVWFDAPNAYVSMTQDWSVAQGKPDDWKTWWLPSEDSQIHYTQFMAKDNVAFHAIFWPGMLMASGRAWKQVDYIKGVNWLTYDKGKFSTSQKRGIFTDTALDLYPADYWRYYLLANCPEGADADFTFSSFAAVVNKDLADILGNFVNRSFALIHKYFEGKVPLQLQESEVDKELQEKANSLVDQFQENLSTLKIRQAAATLRSLWVLGNEYITEQKPWETLKTDPQRAARCLTHCVHLIRLYALTSYSLIPFTAEKLLEMLNDATKDTLGEVDIKDGLDFAFFPVGHPLQSPQRLFDKIEESAIKELIQQYGGVA